MKKIVFSLLFSAAIAAATPVTVAYVNPGVPGIVDANNDYVGPYTLKIGGKNVAAMCMDDFYETSGSWKANLTAVTASDFGKTYLGNEQYDVNGIPVVAVQVYVAEAYLFSQLVQPGADRVDIQDAAWTIMDYVTGHTPHSTSDAVYNIIGDVLQNAGNFDPSGYEIVSGIKGGRNPEQEFIVATPEPASLGLLGGALLLLGMTRAWSKRAKGAVAIG